MTDHDANPPDAPPKRSSRPLSEDDAEMLKFFSGAPRQSARRLMESLYKDDSFYESATYAWVSAADAKKLFLYGACVEVFKACIGLVSDEELLESVPQGEPGQMMKTIAGSVTDTQTYRMRKLIEILVWLILFDRKSAKDEEYRIFLSAENLDLALGRQTDFRDLYDGRTILNTQHSVNDYADRIQRDMGDLGLNEMWFLVSQKLKEKKRPSVFKSKKALLMEALLVATPEERLALGISYGRGYSRTSQAVHPLFGSHGYGTAEDVVHTIKSGISQVSIIAMQVMHLAFKIAGIEDPQGIAAVMGKDLEHSEAASIVGELKKEYEVGDVVLTVWQDLAEVIDVHTSKFGYRAYLGSLLVQASLR